MPPATMRAVHLVKKVNKYSDGEEAVKSCFEVVDVPVPKPKFGQVLVRVHRSSINPSDTSMCQGRYGVFSEYPGFEGAGVVVDSGLHPLALRLRGRRVAFFTLGGAWAEYLAVDATRCIPVSSATAWKNAAGAIANPMTVLEMVRLCDEGKHKSLVCTAGASSLTRQLIRVAKLHGVASIAIVRKADQVQSCLDVGAAVALDSTAEDFVARLEEACRKYKTRIAFDSVAGDVGGQVLSALEGRGVLYVYGFLSGKPVPVLGKDLIFKNKAVRGLTFQQVAKSGPWRLWKMSSELVRLLDNELATDVRATFPLESVADALLSYTKQMSGGKVQLVMVEGA